MQFSINKMLVAVGISLAMVASATPIVDGAVTVVTKVGNSPAATGVLVPQLAASKVAEAPDVVLPLPTNYCSTALYHINQHRQNHSASLNTYNASLATFASVNISSCQVYPGDQPGENFFGLWAQGTNTLNRAQATVLGIDSWYNEEPAYVNATSNFTVAPSFSNFENWGHFTQLVWKTSTSVGCSATLCGAGTPFANSLPGFHADFAWAVVCAWAPSGNIPPASNWVTNVTPPLGQARDNLTIANNAAC